ncbi:MAG: VIT domain-containing protein [Xanthobacteraceae bacterium]
MSNLQSRLSAVKFEPVPERVTPPPSEAILLFGVIYPAVIIVLELISGMCANAFFDPLPTYWHALVAGLVPAGNLLLWHYLQDSRRQGARWMAFVNGAAITIAGFYTLLFLPLLPLAVVAIIVAIGLLPFAPLASFVCAIKLCGAMYGRHAAQGITRAFLGGLAVGLALLLAPDIPAGATRLGMQWAASSDPAQRERGLTLLRTLGDDDLLLRLCYGTAGRPAGLLSAFVMFGGDSVFPPRPRRQSAQSPAEAREIYYRVHGVPFNSKPAPFDKSRRTGLADVRFDEDHGGAQVGGRAQGLQLASSRIDGSVSGDDAVAYLEWTVEFRNSEPVPREARLQLALPPGGVVSRATLWVNGEEREAAYGGRSHVRAAYQRVAVQQRRDPLLVTSKGADRVLAQAFPVPAHGTIKFKLGISAPLDIVEPSKARLTLPALVDRNFTIGPDVSHSVWIESRQALATSVASLPVSPVDGRTFRIAGSVGDRDLARTRQTITVDRNPVTGNRAARIGDGELIVQDAAPSGAPSATAALLLVIDGSARLTDTAAKLIAALDAIPPGLKVGAIVATEPMQKIAPAPWSYAQKRNVAKLIRATRFVGGQDNAPALAEALVMLESEPQATLIWIHGPQPVSFGDGAARLEQAAARLSRLPDVVLYSVEPGPNEVLPDAPWAWAARSLPQTGALDADLAGFFARMAGQTHTFAVRRAEGHASEGQAKGSDHIARLWASTRVLELMRADPTGNRAAAVALASRYHLVTPVSGAVVLETQQQYDESRLTPVSQAQATVPTVPEPHEWALLLVACAMLGWFAWHGRQRLVAA